MQNLLTKGLWLAGAVTLASPGAASAASAEPARLPAEVVALQRAALAGTSAADLARSLATEAGPRLAGSEGLARGVEWGLRTLAGLGFENVRAEPVTVPHWERGRAAGEIVAPFPQSVALAALGGSIGTVEAGLEAEVVATENLDTLAKLPPEAVRGKIVYFGERMQRTRDGAGYGKTVPIRTRGPVAAARLGAVAVLIRSVGTDSNRLPHTGTTMYEEGGARIPAAALSIPDADLLEQEVLSGRPVRFRLHLGCRTLPDVESANVVGDLRGRERPEEIVVLSGHLDSWDLGTGALDDAAGIGNAIAAARLIAGLPERPRRTIRIVLYANEEFGLSGGKAYAAAHADEAAKHQAVLESDLGSGRVFRLRTAFAEDDVALSQELARALAPLGVERDASTRATGGADVSPLVAAGVPTVDLAHDVTTYFDFHHTANDTADKLAPADMAQATAAFATVAWMLAEHPNLLRRATVAAKQP
ncbi:MAG: M28 family peptidase [Thermoanaerobaculia bacterium]